MQLTCDSNVTICFTLFNNFKNFFRACYEPFGDTFDVGDSIFILMNAQVDFGH